MFFILPRRSQYGPRRPQDVPKTAQDDLKTAQDGPRNPKTYPRRPKTRPSNPRRAKAAQDTPKMPPRCPQDELKMPTRWHQDGLKMASRWPQDDPQDGIRLGVDFRGGQGSKNLEKHKENQCFLPSKKPVASMRTGSALREKVPREKTLQTASPR